MNINIYAQRKKEREYMRKTQRSERVVCNVGNVKKEFYNIDTIRNFALV